MQELLIRAKTGAGPSVGQVCNRCHGRTRAIHTWDRRISECCGAGTTTVRLDPVTGEPELPVEMLRAEVYVVARIRPGPELLGRLVAIGAVVPAEEA